MSLALLGGMRVGRRLLIVGLMASAMFVLWTPHASALVPTDIPPDLRQNLVNYDSGPYVRPQDSKTYPAGCSSIPEKYLTTGWVSAAGQPAVDDFTVPYGTTSIPLQWQINDLVCKDHATLNGANYPGLPRDGTPVKAALTEFRSTVDTGTITASLGSITPGSLGNELVMSSSNTSRYWFTGSNGFTLNLPPNQPSKKYTILISFMSRGVNQFNGGSYTCLVGPTRPGMDASNYNDPNSPSRCDESPYSFAVNITVNCGSGTTGGPGVCAPITCDTLTVTPKNPEPGRAISLAGTIKYSGGTPPTVSGQTLSIALQGQPDQPVVPATVTEGGGAITISGTKIVVATGLYSATWSIIANGLQISCGGNFAATDSFTVALTPFFSVRGGDIVTGASIATGGTPCSVAATGHIADAGIVSWNHDGVPDYSGAGSQYAALALNFIQDFATRQVTGGTDQLSLANKNYPVGSQSSVAPASGFFGGMFASAPCVDYWSRRPGPLNALPAGAIASWPSDTYNVKASPAPGGLTINGGTLPSDRHITLYVDGDVNITGDINYIPAYSSRSAIPSFRLIVHGRIFIDAGVHNLDGLYAAIPDTGYADSTAQINTFGSPPNGTISTCSNGYTSYDPTDILTAPIYTLCNKPLIVNGSVAALQLWLLRNAGSLTSRVPAEIFNYSPDTWLAPGDDAAAGSSDENYQSIVGLPPVL